MNKNKRILAKIRYSNDFTKPNIMQEYKIKSFEISKKIIKLKQFMLDQKKLLSIAGISLLALVFTTVYSTNKTENKEDNKVLNTSNTIVPTSFSKPSLITSNNIAQIPNESIVTTDSINQLSIDSLDIMIGQMILFGFYGTDINVKDKVYKAAKEGKIGGILLYERNINPKNSQEKLKKLNADYQKISKIPLFISIDQEGGIVNRLRKQYGFPDMVSAFEMGKKNDTSYTRKYANIMGQSCNQMGINVNYAPVLDIHKANNPVLGSRERCFSDDVSVITNCANDIIDVQNANNVISVLKHFPGHGSSTKDSHKGLTDVSKTWNKNELIPYVNLINTGKVDMIMTAHIINTQLDKKKIPATLSDVIIQKLLRDSLKYDGVVISDDLNMKAISNFYKLKDAIELSINAGVDMLMFSNNIDGVSKITPQQIHLLIRHMVLCGDIERTRIIESYNRIMLLKNKIK